MSEITNIQWTDHTFNPWSGCAKVSPGCANCYAANLPPAMRRHAIWGPNAERIRASAEYLKQPHTWNRKAEKDWRRHRVFCASVADVFEARADLDPWREDLLCMIRDTPHLDWQLLTKRPEYAAKFLHGRNLPPNLWIGTSVENQDAADTRIPHLLKIPAKVRFLSMEPLLGPVNLDPATCQYCGNHGENIGLADDGATPWCTECSNEAGFGWWLDPCADEGQAGINWVIAGCESGRIARPMDLDWVRAIRDACNSAGVPFFFKQANIDGEIVGLPKLDGEVWAQFPEVEPAANPLFGAP